MKKYFAKDENAMRNGSFIVVYAQTYSRYMNGDYMGSTTHRNGFEGQCTQVRSEGYKEFSPKDFKG